MPDDNESLSSRSSDHQSVGGVAPEKKSPGPAMGQGAQLQPSVNPQPSQPLQSPPVDNKPLGSVQGTEQGANGFNALDTVQAKQDPPAAKIAALPDKTLGKAGQWLLGKLEKAHGLQGEKAKQFYQLDDQGEIKQDKDGKPIAKEHDHLINLSGIGKSAVKKLSDSKAMGKLTDKLSARHGMEGEKNKPFYQLDEQGEIKKDPRGRPIPREDDHLANLSRTGRFALNLFGVDTEQVHYKEGKHESGGEGNLSRPAKWLLKKLAARHGLHGEKNDHYYQRDDQGDFIRDDEGNRKPKEKDHLIGLSRSGKFMLDRFGFDTEADDEQGKKDEQDQTSNVPRPGSDEAETARKKALSNRFMQTLDLFGKRKKSNEYSATLNGTDDQLDNPGTDRLKGPRRFAAKLSAFLSSIFKSRHKKAEPEEDMAEKSPRALAKSSSRDMALGFEPTTAARTGKQAHQARIKAFSERLKETFLKRFNFIGRHREKPQGRSGNDIEMTEMGDRPASFPHFAKPQAPLSFSTRVDRSRSFIDFSSHSRDSSKDFQPAMRQGNVFVAQMKQAKGTWEPSTGQRQRAYTV